MTVIPVSGKVAAMGKVYSLYFSASGNTRRITKLIADNIASEIGEEGKPVSIDFTPKAAREEDKPFQEGDIVVVGFPTYAGRLPNKIAPDIKEHVLGNGARAVAVVTFGNRNFDNSLAELTEILTGNGFNVVSGAAFACRHAFTDDVGTGRPSDDDINDAVLFAKKSAEKIRSNDMTKPEIPGDPNGKYYTPLNENGEPAKFLKAFPKVDTDKCTDCGTCAKVCPMDSISHDDVTVMTGICIKCQACVRDCPEGARYFDDEAFLSHVRMLKKNFTEPKKNKLFV